MSRTRMASHASGRRDKWVQLVPQTQSKGSSGFPVDSDATSINLWASKQDVSGEERFNSSHLTAPFTTLWGFEYRADFNPDLVDVPKAFLLVYEGRRYDIQTATVIGNKEGIEMTTLARQG